MKTLRNIAEYLRAIVEQLSALVSAMNRLADAWDAQPKRATAPETEAPETEAPETEDGTPGVRTFAEIMDSTELKRRYTNTRMRHLGWTSTSTMERRHGIKMREAQLIAIANERGWELQFHNGRPYIKDECAQQIAEELAR